MTCAGNVIPGRLGRKNKSAVGAVYLCKGAEGRLAQRLRHRIKFIRIPVYRKGQIISCGFGVVVHVRALVDVAVRIVRSFAAGNVFISRPHKKRKRFPLGIIRPFFSRLNPVYIVPAERICKIQILFSADGINKGMHVYRDKNVMIAGLGRCGLIKVLVIYKRRIYCQLAVAFIVTGSTLDVGVLSKRTGRTVGYGHAY